MGFNNTAMPPIDKHRSAGFEVVAMPGPGRKNFSITASPNRIHTSELIFQEIAQVLKEEHATIVSHRVFSGREPQLDGIQLLHQNGDGVNWPVTSLLGNGDSHNTSTNSQVCAISGSSVTPLRLDGQIVGSVFGDEDADYCVLGNLRPKDVSVSSRNQAESVFERAEAALQMAGMNFLHVVRTWFFMDKILDWYDDFNSVRTSYFSDRGVFGHLLPASTGVGAGNVTGAALVADVLAIRPKIGRMSIREVPSPLQGAATSYKSSFSRAVQIDTIGQRRLIISGTASIAADGKTAYKGDVEKQIALTMEVVKSILEQGRMNWSDVTRGVAYFRDIDSKQQFDRYLRNNHLPFLPIVIASADICRDDLLFEIELDAAVLD